MNDRRYNYIPANENIWIVFVVFSGLVIMAHI
jgi:hypothetical protein